VGGDGGLKSSVQWKTEEGMTYYIKIHGSHGAVGDFGMTLSTGSFASTMNDAFLDSVGLSPSINETVVVSLAGSTPDDVPVCSIALLNAPGTWYQMDGNDKVISTSSCSPLTNVATEISVFSGSCEDLSCVSEGISRCTCQDTVYSKVVLLTEEGNIYFILLQSADGYGGDVGMDRNGIGSC
jgi:hypothetical protein